MVMEYIELIIELVSIRHIVIELVIIGLLAIDKSLTIEWAIGRYIINIAMVASISTKSILMANINILLIPAT